MNCAYRHLCSHLENGEPKLRRSIRDRTMHKRTKIKVAIGVLMVGMACMFVAVVSDHWAVLRPRMKKVNETCEAAHFGLWRLCKKSIYIGPENYIEGHGCGPISLPGGKEDCSNTCGRRL